MGRLPKLDRDQVAPEIGKIYDTYMKERGNIPNAFRTLAALPSYLTTVIDHYRQVMFTGEGPFEVKELVFLHVSRLNHSRY